MIGQTIAHYRIIEKLGQGGMGEVFLADDAKLQRRVALKFLPESLRNDPESRERLLREARAASQLSHPNILTIHAVEEADGRDFIVMEYLDGQTLSEYCRTHNPTALQSLELIRQIAEGLSAAHKRGITHRDIKPANILVDSDARLKILDFGLAKQKGLAKLTRDGSTVGTMAYISPEQIEGREADARSDLFSLGVIAYELLSGRRPFEGEHEAALVYAIAHEQAPPLEAGAVVPDGLKLVVNRLLAKRPEDRFQSAADLLGELRILQSSSSNVASLTQPTKPRRGSVIGTLVGVVIIAVALLGWLVIRDDSGSEQASSSGRKMLAVLPFENLGPADQEYFADGMTEEITARLASVQDLGVIARTSILQYKGTTKPLDQIGKELGVDYILEGTVRWQKGTSGPDQVRITPQLVRVSDETHVWAEVFDAVLDEVFTVQSNVARKVVEALNVKLVGTEPSSLDARPTENMQAYDLYLRGREYFHQSIGGTNERALRLAAQVYEQAVGADSNFAVAWAALSQIYTETYWHQDQDPTLLAKSVSAMQKAQQLAPGLPEGLVAKGSVLYHAGKYPEALVEFAKVEERQPNNSEVILETAFIHRRMGNPQEAIARFIRAATLDPQSDRALAEAGVTKLWNHEYADAESLLTRALRLTPDCATCWMDLADAIVLQTGNAQRALDTLLAVRSIIEIDGDYFQLAARLNLWAGNFEAAAEYAAQGDGSDTPGGRYLTRASALALLGDSMMARVFYDSARVCLGGTIYSDPSSRMLAQAYAFAGLGLVAEARAWLDSLSIRLQSTKYAQSNSALVLASIHVILGEHQKALDILEREIDPPSFINEHVLRLEPRLKPLHRESRFQTLLSRSKRSS